MSTSLSPKERAEVLDVLDARLAQTAAGFTRGASLIGALFFLMAVVFVAKQAWGVAVLVGGFGAGLVALGALAARRTSPERMRPVLEALRAAPEAVVSIRHYETSDTRKVFRTQWIEVKTAEHRLVVKANDDWHMLLDRLSRLCPRAEVKQR